MLYLYLTLLFATTALCVLSPQNLGEHLSAVVKPFHTSCSISSGCSEECIDNVKKGQFDTADIPAKKYVACLWTVSGVLTPSFHLNPLVLEYYMPPKVEWKEDPIYFKCLEVGKNSAEKLFIDKIFLTTKCIYESHPKTYIMF